MRNFCMGVEGARTWVVTPLEFIPLLPSGRVDTIAASGVWGLQHIQSSITADSRDKATDLSRSWALSDCRTSSPKAVSAGERWASETVPSRGCVPNASVTSSPFTAAWYAARISPYCGNDSTCRTRVSTMWHADVNMLNPTLTRTSWPLRKRTARDRAPTVTTPATCAVSYASFRERASVTGRYRI